MNSVGRIIASLRTGGEAAALFDELKSALAAPLAGMGVSFSASLFGLAGSLVLGFLDLQAGQAQNRFYMELEDWLAVTAAPDHADGTSTPDIAAALQRLAEAVDRNGGQAPSAAMANLAESIQEIVQQMRSEQQLVRMLLDGQATRDRELRAVIDQLGRERAR